MRQIAISDIHGCKKTFDALIDHLGISQGDELLLLGDYIDRGPDSKGVFESIFSIIEQGITVHSLIGNHEEMLLKGFADKRIHQMWLSNGGIDTLRSFEAKEITGIEDRFLDFMNRLKHIHFSSKMIFVHAGLNFLQMNPLEDKAAMLWIRNWYQNIDYKWLGGRIVVHGHTPVNRDEIELALENLEDSQVLNIDNGCFRVGESGKGNLCAFEIAERRLYFQKNLDMHKSWRTF